MAIYFEDLDTVGNFTSKANELINGEGNSILSSIKSTVDNLKSHWEGTDAFTNISDLVNVYNDVAKLLRDMNYYICEVNNSEIRKQQQSNIDLNGSSVLADEIGDGLSCEELSLPSQSTHSRTDNAIIADADAFNNIPERFNTFINDFKSEMDKLFGNWQDSNNHEAAYATYEKFKNIVGDYCESVKTVRNNLNVVAETKKQFL